jgi:CelD/BcsL family acetyltransferase involved in cellulose biosynthesis
MRHFALDLAPRTLASADQAPSILSLPEAATTAIASASDIPPALREEWWALTEEAAQPNSFAEPWFVEASLPHFAPAGGLHLVQARKGGRLIGVATFGTAPRYGRAPLRHVENWRHHNHFFGAPLVRRGEETAFWTAALAALDEASWAKGFLHVTGLVENGPIHRGLTEAAASLGRGCPVVHRERRPLLQSDLDPEAYYERNVGRKRRSEYRRLRSRLAELGRLEVRELRIAEELDCWCDAFLALEAAGWKGEKGSAMACSAATAAFFRSAIASAFAAGRLHFLRLDLDGRPLAMLTSLLAPPGAFGFKSAFDESFARYSPGILLQLENLRILDRPDIDWTDSCASADHPVASLWSEWRSLVRVTVRLRGLSGLLSYGSARLLEEGARLASRRPGR